uniref:Uncharacterized protein n=1 Tax=Rhizophora mucronata TaxID=61149 RepID=A0A2P2P766_RHIMU
MVVLFPLILIFDVCLSSVDPKELLGLQNRQWTSSCFPTSRLVWEWDSIPGLIELHLLGISAKLASLYLDMIFFDL